MKRRYRVEVVFQVELDIEGDAPEAHYLAQQRLAAKQAARMQIGAALTYVDGKLMVGQGIGKPEARAYLSLDADTLTIGLRDM